MIAYRGRRTDSLPCYAIDRYAQVAQSVEHVLGKDEVGGSIPLLGFVRVPQRQAWNFFSE
jgi:hypothetical protein